MWRLETACGAKTMARNEPCLQDQDDSTSIMLTSHGICVHYDCPHPALSGFFVLYTGVALPQKFTQMELPSQVLRFGFGNSYKSTESSLHLAQSAVRWCG